MTTRIAFIDTYLIDYHLIVNALHPSIHVELIYPLQDGWQQIARAMARHSNHDGRKIDAIDIISHGAPGSVILGSGMLNATTFSAYAGTLAEIGKYLSDDADILLYGCDVGAGSAGTSLLNQLAAITGANIAASTDITGAAAMGGNWLLEASAGFVNTAVLQFPTYSNILAAPQTTEVTLLGLAEDSLSYLITQAMLLANASDIDGDSLTAIGLAIVTGNGSLVDNLDGSWTYKPTLNDDSAVSFSYKIRDGSLTAEGRATLDLMPVNDAPTLQVALLDQLSGLGQVFSYTLPANTFADVDVDDSLTLSASLANGDPLPAWLSFDGPSRTFSGTPPAGTALGAIDISVTVTDSSLLAISDSFKLNLLNTITGTPNADTLNGSVVDDAIYGLEGFDTLYGFGGNDLLDGGTGFDRLFGGQGNDTLLAGNDADSSQLFGEDGNDTLTGSGGSDYLDGGHGSDVLQGGDGNDTLYDFDYSGLVSSNSLEAGTGDDSISVYQQNVNSVTTVSGGSGRDIYDLRPYSIGQLLVSDFAGGATGDILNINNLLTSSSYSAGNPFDAALGYLRLLQQGADTLLQWDPDGVAATRNNWQTVITLQNTNATTLTAENFTPAAPPDGSSVGLTLTGTPNNDKLNGSVVDDAIYGLEGFDTLYGFGGNDLLDGGTGYDYLFGGQGNDTLLAGNDADGSQLVGEDGNDTLTGSGGNDIMYGGSGNDTLQGGDGNDTLYDFDYSGLVSSNSLEAGTGDDSISVYQQNVNSVTTVSGGSGRDIYDLRPYSIGQLLVSDFAGGATGDILNINNLLTSSSYSAGNPFDAALGYLRLLQQGADTLLQWDPDGVAATRNNWQTVITLQNTNAATLISENFTPATGITSITVVQSNTAPVLSVQLADQMADEDAAFNFVVPANTFSDPDAGDTLSYFASLANGAALPAWLSFNANTRSFSGTPSQADVAIIDVRVSVRDAGSLLASDVFTLTVNNVYDAPTGTATASLIAGTEDTAYTINASDLLQGFTDVDGDTLSVDNLTANHGTLTNNNNGTYTFNPDANYNGSVSLNYNVVDGNGGSVAASQPVSLTAVNDVAVIAGNTTGGVKEDLISFTTPEVYTVEAVTTATRNGTLSVAVADVNGDGRPDLVTANFDSSSVSVLMNEGNGIFAAPVQYGIGASGTASVAVADINGDGWSDLVTSNYSSGSMSALLNNGNGTFATPTVYSLGSGDSYTVVIGDMNGDGRPDVVTALGYNNAVSVLLNNGNGGFVAPTVYGVGAFGVYDVDVADINGDGKLDIVTSDQFSDAVSVLLNNGNGGFATPIVHSVGGTDPTRIAVTDINSDGRLDLVTPVYGSIAASVLLNNGNGGFAAPTLYGVGASYLISVEVADVNGDSRPDLITANLYDGTVSVLTNNGVGSFDSPVLYNVGASALINLSMADVNADNQPDIITANFYNNSVSVLLNKGSATSGILNISDVDVGEAKFQAPVATALLGIYGDFIFNDTTGAWTYTLRNNDTNVQALSDAQQVTDTFTVTSFDGSASQTVTVTVTGTNDVPVLTTQTASATEDSVTVTINALATASDVDTGTTLSVVNIPAQLPAGVTYNATTHNFTLDPSHAAYQVLAVGQSTTVSINYGVSDGIATISTSVTFTVTGTNDAPTGTATASLIAGTEDTAYTINASDLLQGFADVDGDVLSVSGLTADQGSIITNNNGTYTFNPAANYNGSVSLNYNVVDGNGGSVAASQPVSLAAVNDAPVAVDNILAATEDTTVIYTAADILGNDTDIDNNTLCIAAVTSGAGGTTVLNANGSVSFTPVANFNGAASFSCTANDGSTISNTANVTVNVTPVNDMPILITNLVDRAFIRSSTFAFTIPTGSFSDIDADNLTYSAQLIDGNPLPTWLQFNAETATFSGNPAIPDVGEISVKVTASDPAGLSIDDVFVLSINTLPNDIVGTANADNLTGTNGSDVIYGLADNDQLNGGAGSDQLIGGAGNDNLNGGAGIDTMYGGLGDDIYVVNVPGDVIVENMSAGKDTVRSGVSYILSANLEDLIMTGTANISGVGNALDNVLNGNSGDNTLQGEMGDDLLNGGLGSDLLFGGLGNDIYMVDNKGDTVTELGAEGIDTVHSSIGIYTLSANLENLLLLSGAKNGNGNNLNNVITGNSIDNLLKGGEGDDQLYGLSGNDTLTGGIGNDHFVFSTMPALGNVDTVTDFTLGQDKLFLDATVFTGLNLHNQALDASMFRSGAGITTAADANDHLMFNTSNSALYYDNDGAGGAAAVQIATLSGVTSLDSGSIWIMG